MYFCELAVKLKLFDDIRVVCRLCHVITHIINICFFQIADATKSPALLLSKRIIDIILNYDIVEFLLPFKLKQIDVVYSDTEIISQIEKEANLVTAMFMPHTPYERIQANTWKIIDLIRKSIESKAGTIAEYLSTNFDESIRQLFGGNLQYSIWMDLNEFLNEAEPVAVQHDQ